MVFALKTLKRNMGKTSVFPLFSFRQKYFTLPAIKVDKAITMVYNEMYDAD